MDLWKQLLVLIRKYRVQFIWVKGHASIPENERCDQLAVEASHGEVLLEDTWYVENKDETFI